MRDVGVEIDRVARSPRGGLVWFEYKGSVQGTRLGLLRTDTLKKAITNGALLQRLVEKPAYIVLTSHLPNSGAGLAMLQTASRAPVLRRRDLRIRPVADRPSQRALTRAPRYSPVGWSTSSASASERFRFGELAVATSNQKPPRFGISVCTSTPARVDQRRSTP